MTTVYGWLLAIAVALCGGWYAHHNIYQSGFDAAKKADDKTLDAAADSVASAQRSIEAVKASQKECEDGRIADQAASKDAVKAADDARATIAAKFKSTDKALRSKMAGECSAWAKTPACGSDQ